MSAAPQVGMLFFNCNKRFLPALNLKLLHRQTQSIMRLAHLQKFDLSVDFVGNRAMQILNRKHRGKDVPTDVLSFPAFQIKAGHSPPEAIEAIGESWDMGKIVLSVPYIFEQCVELDSNLEARLPRLVAHGIFHMLGYDHETDADFLKMRAREVALLGELQKLYPNHPIDTD